MLPTYNEAEKLEPSVEGLGPACQPGFREALAGEAELVVECGGL